MAISVVSQSSLLLTTGEQTVGSAVTTGKTVVLKLDLSTMAAGDVIELHCYTKVAGSGDTARREWVVSWANAQGYPHQTTVAQPEPYSCEFKLKQPTGTARTIPYVLFTL